MTLLRGALAVVAGIGVFALALFGIDAAGTAIVGAEPEWINRSNATRSLWLCVNVVCMIVGGYVAAWIASRARVAHALLVGIIQTGLTLAAFLTLNDASTPTWLWVSGMVLTVPSAWIGGLLSGRRANPAFPS
jgi:putative membrane protein (TIGR04086 family)